MENSIGDTNHSVQILSNHENGNNLHTNGAAAVKTKCFAEDEGSRRDSNARSTSKTTVSNKSEIESDVEMSNTSTVAAAVAGGRTSFIGCLRKKYIDDVVDLDVTGNLIRTPAPSPLPDHQPTPLCATVSPTPVPTYYDKIAHDQLCQRLPRHVVLDDYDIISVKEDVAELASYCSRVCELDVSHNRIQSWHCVQKLVQAAPALSFLNLSFNPLHQQQQSLLHDAAANNMYKTTDNNNNNTNNSCCMSPSLLNQHQQQQHSFPLPTFQHTNLTRLILNNTHTPWPFVVHEILHWLPNLNELHVSLNQYSTLKFDDHDEHEASDEASDIRNKSSSAVDATPPPDDTDVDCDDADANSTDADNNDNNNAEMPLNTLSPRPLPDNVKNKRRRHSTACTSSSSVSSFSTTTTPPTTTATAFPNMQCVNFDSNQLHDPYDIYRIGQLFPNIQTLYLTRNPLKNFSARFRCAPTPPSKTTTTTPLLFSKLGKLTLNHVAIDSWCDIETLGEAFAALSELRIVDIPLTQQQQTATASSCVWPNTDEEFRQHFVALLPNVQIFNGSPICADERETCERALLRAYSDPGSSSTLPKLQRLSHLQLKHGPLQPLVQVDLRPKTSVQMTIRYGDKCQLRAVNVCQTVQQLRTTLCQWRIIPLVVATNSPSSTTTCLSTRVRIYYIDSEIKEMSGPEELRYPGRRLHSYHMQDGDELLIEPK